ncbi:class I SAM-dependent methyltransferase [Deinococcus enclensis]|uniref:SAM-dependent methyltransferase n=1 Tax=Deinococcus enclensis TaxID=1049582 RepID=A0ABT9MFG5_9DEIO|nr:class I SAM-dependent methyltransferase [Deinococcus enclensis]MDP9765352.1 SAM-dependent methyltransferase [Deinococcus enclensis]
MSLADRDALLSRLAGVAWPAGPLLDALALLPEADVLDVGAGDGGLLRAWRARGHRGRLAGVDPAPGPGVQAGTAGALPFPEGAFDAALFVRSLSHVPDARGALREARRVLRPGGQLVLAVHGAGHLRALWQAEGGAASGPGPEVALLDLLRAEGFTAARRDVQAPVRLSRSQGTRLMELYGRAPQWEEGRFPLEDTLHLVVLTAKP